jgi:DNA-binding MarR family transcriptional regulator
MDDTLLPPPSDERWRQAHLGHWLYLAGRRFETRVLALVGKSAEAPLALSNLAARQQVNAAHLHVTRHLRLQGDRLTDLAERAGMSKQAMGDLVDQCAAWGLVRREPDPQDRRARRIVFTATGLDWLSAFQKAIEAAEAEARTELGEDVLTVVRLGLEAYASSPGD